MFRVRDGGVIEPVPLSAALEANGLGTGAVAGIDNDGVLDRSSHMVKRASTLSLSALISKTPAVISKLPRPVRRAGRGATVVLKTNMSARKDDRCRKWLSLPDGAVALVFVKTKVITSVFVRWTDGTEDDLGEVEENTVHNIRKNKTTSKPHFKFCSVFSVFPSGAVLLSFSHSSWR